MLEVVFYDVTNFYSVFVLYNVCTDMATITWGLCELCLHRLSSLAECVVQWPLIFCHAEINVGGVVGEVTYCATWGVEQSPLWDCEAWSHLSKVGPCLHSLELDDRTMVVCIYCSRCVAKLEEDILRILHSCVGADYVTFRVWQLILYTWCQRQNAWNGKRQDISEASSWYFHFFLIYNDG